MIDWRNPNLTEPARVWAWFKEILYPSLAAAVIFVLGVIVLMYMGVL
jgi:hypothetical protein